MKSQYNIQAETIIEKLDAVSTTMCLAKWTQVTMHLQNGHTHSCHHPSPHFISVDELKQNKYALHNTEHKIEQRKQMLEGKQPKECQYCWNIENLNKGYLSDRHYKSGEYWSREYYDDIVKNPLIKEFLPSYVEVSFSNVCNFGCMYCSPQVSSKWVEDITKHGPYNLKDFKHHDLSYLKSQKLMPIPEREDNPYTDAFWEMWPELYKKLRVFRITGGEPLLSKHTWKILKYIQENPNPNLEIIINSNLCVQDQFIDRLVAVGNDLIVNNKVKRFEIYTSIESFDEQAEYIRYGMDFKQFIDNLNKVVTDIPMIAWKSKVVIMVTYNILSIPKFRKLLQWLLDYRKEHAPNDWKNIWIDVSYLRYPDWQSINLVDNNLLSIMEQDLAFMKEQDQAIVGYHGFQDTEIEKFSRAIEYARSNIDNDHTINRNRFYHFFNEYDRRKNINFLKTFPELKDFYNACKPQ